MSLLIFFKKKKCFFRLKKYLALRYKKNSQKYFAELVHKENIFQKWNLLSKKKIILRLITIHHYSKYLFIR